MRDPRCYEPCLEAERICKSNLDTTRSICRGQPGYASTYASLRALHAAGEVTTEEQCRKYGQWGKQFMKEKVGETLANIGPACSCLVCEEAMAGSSADEAPADARRRIEASLASDLRGRRGRGKPGVLMSNDALRSKLESMPCDEFYKYLGGLELTPQQCHIAMSAFGARCPGPLSC